ncbi:adenylate kinase [Occultella kanbiaonis]|uniref:adenylate kinase n=1 Tax=Occultella kanbiaonis TaxID=2675754 RepID=UPI0013CF7423|nr:adenylate kinase [Occultella kanbiaonis]
MGRGSVADLRRARRVLCYGVTGSGKSTLALRLGAELALPVTLVDEHYWEPGWVPAPQEQFEEYIASTVSGPRWVVDTAYARHLDAIFQRADVIVALDYPRLVSLTRLVRRTCRNIVTRAPLCNGNVETLRNALSGDSIIRWHFTSWRSKRSRMRAWAADPGVPPVLLLGRPADTERALAQLRSSPNRSS